MSLFISGEKHDWSDVTPVLQDDGPAPVAAMKYSAAYWELMDLFRTILASEEYSAKTVALTEENLTHNAANYTVWHFRRNAIKA
jgi:protein farnesyltransferase/geranylgeranyltransferase type-1 subunit alpha